MPLTAAIRTDSIKLAISGYPSLGAIPYVLRQIDGRPDTICSAGGAGSATSVEVTDWEAPYGIPVTYIAGIAGNAWSAQITVTLPARADGGITLRDTRPDGIGLPDVAHAKLELGLTFDLPQRSIAHDIIGSPTPAWTIHAPGAERGSLPIRIETLAEWQRFADVVDSGYPIHVRSCAQHEWRDGRIMVDGAVTVARAEIERASGIRPWLITIPYIRLGVGDLA
jgi:hypothetical protein